METEPLPENSKNTDEQQLATLRAEFEEYKEAQAKREADLRAEISGLRQALAMKSVTSPEPTETLVAFHTITPSEARATAVAPYIVAEAVLLKDHSTIVAQQPPAGPQVSHVDARWDDDDSERSMILATPLQPTVVLDDGHAILTANPPLAGPALPFPIADAVPAKDIVVDPLSIPLPLSPAASPPPDTATQSHSPPLSHYARAAALRERPPTPFSFSAASGDAHGRETEKEVDNEPPHSSVRGNTRDRMQDVESQLETARRDVAGRDEELVALGRVINEMRVQARDSGLQ